jgi:hypothetical protein
VAIPAKPAPITTAVLSVTFIFALNQTTLDA